MRKVYTFSVTSGLLLRMEHTETVTWCYCEPEIRTPFTFRNAVWELTATNQR